MREISRIPGIVLSLVIVMFLSGCQSQNTGKQTSEPQYVFNRPPLVSNPYTELPIGAVQPRGWLQEQLRLMAEGMTGHLDELYPQVVGERNGWLGGDGDGWERGPYWLDGLVPLAYLQDNDKLIQKAKPWIEWTLNSQTETGYFGPVPFEEAPEREPGIQKTPRRDWWPHMVMLKVLQQYYSATGDERVIELMTNYFRYQLEQLPDRPLDHWTNWGRNRGGENLASVYWLYNRTGDEFLLDLADILNEQTDPWTEWFTDGSLIAEGISTYDFPHWSSIHGVNLAMAIKQPGVYYQQSGEGEYLQAVNKALADLKEYHGQPQGMFGNDELLHGTSPTQGTELCTVVELMFSLESLLQITGDVVYADQLEKITYNALPTHINDDFTARQYLQQPNQVLITERSRNFITDHNGTDLCYGLLTGYPCCTTNLHQGWPKYVQNLWYATGDGGLAALAYAPGEVTAKVTGGVTVKFREETSYPFDETIRFVFSGDQPVSFPLHLRIPAWSKGASITINNEEVETPGAGNIWIHEREWHDGDMVELTLPMDIRTSRWHENSVAIERGPILYALPVDSEWRQIDEKMGYGTYEVFPTENWNYGIINEALQDPETAFEIIRKGVVSPQPWSPDSAPIELRVMGKQIPSWQLYNGSAGPLPYSPVEAGQAEEVLTLIPYGCTDLRISEFPVVR